MSRRASVFARQNPGRRRVRFPDEIVFEESIKESDGEVIMKMLRRDSVSIDVDRINMAGMTALHQAVLDNNLVVVKILLHHGAEIDKVDIDSWTPLHAAAANGHHAIAKYLVSQGANKNAMTDEGESPEELVDPNNQDTLNALLGEVDKGERDRRMSLVFERGEPAWLRRESIRDDLRRESFNNIRARKGSMWNPNELNEEDEEDDEDEDDDYDDGSNEDIQEDDKAKVCVRGMFRPSRLTGGGEARKLTTSMTKSQVASTPTLNQLSSHAATTSPSKPSSLKSSIRSIDKHQPVGRAAEPVVVRPQFKLSVDKHLGGDTRHKLKPLDAKHSPTFGRKTLKPAFQPSSPLAKQPPTPDRHKEKITSTTERQRDKVNPISDRQKNKITSSPDRQKDKVTLPPDRQKGKATLPPDRQKEKVTLPPDRQKDKVTLPPDRQKDKVTLTPDRQKDKVTLIQDRQKDKVTLIPDRQKINFKSTLSRPSEKTSSALSRQSDKIHTTLNQQSDKTSSKVKVEIQRTQQLPQVKSEIKSVRLSQLKDELKSNSDEPIKRPTIPKVMIDTKAGDSLLEKKKYCENSLFGSKVKSSSESHLRLRETPVHTDFTKNTKNQLSPATVRNSALKGSNAADSFKSGSLVTLKSSHAVDSFKPAEDDVENLLANWRKKRIERRER